MAKDQMIAAAVIGGMLLVGIGVVIGTQWNGTGGPKPIAAAPQGAPATPSAGPAPAPADLPSQATAAAPVAAKPQNDQTAVAAPSDPPPTVAQMRSLGQRVASGDATAMAQLQDISRTLYRDIDYSKDQDRVLSNLRLMKAAFDEIGEEAGKQNADAFEALQIAVSQKELSSFAPDALGIAAAAGNDQALDILLHHDRWGILLSSAVFAVQASAANNNDKAVDFLIEVIGNPDERGLWNPASRGLAGASVKGNTKAKAALDAFEAKGGLKAGN